MSLFADRLDAGPGALSAARHVAVRTQRRRWRRTDIWEDHAYAGLASVVAAVLSEAEGARPAVAVDIGSGGGALTIPLARIADRVLAVDLSPRMLARLEQRAVDEGLDNIEAYPLAIEEFDLPSCSVDLVVSNYALHHLLDRDKEILVRKAGAWLRPGGKLVIGDMMIGRGWDRGDREVMMAKVRVLLARGPGGWWRVAKNGWRLVSRTVERPIPMSAWADLLSAAGFVEVTAHRVVAEAAIVAGRRS